MTFCFPDDSGEQFDDERRHRDADEHQQCGDAEVGEKNGDEDAAELVPILRGGQFSDPFLRGEAESKIQENSIAEDAPEQTPETEFLIGQAFKEQAKKNHAQPESNHQKDVVRDRVAINMTF